MSSASQQHYTYDDYHYFGFERSFHHTGAITRFAREHYQIPLYTVGLYLLMLPVGQWLVRDMHPMKVNRALVLWNGGLSLFSLCGSYRTVPVLYQYIMSSSITDVICRPADVWIGTGPTGLWVTLFVASKFPELIDTVFLVVRKKRVPFLHWYHHASTLLYTWHACANPANYALSFVAMNYYVHSMMYAYYCLAAMGIKTKFLPPLFITVHQIAQMFVGMSVQLAATYFYFLPGSCNVDGHNILCGGAMYLSYFILFIKFANKRYSGKKSD